MRIFLDATSQRRELNRERERKKNAKKIDSMMTVLVNTLINIKCCTYTKEVLI